MTEENHQDYSNYPPQFYQNYPPPQFYYSYDPQNFYQGATADYYYQGNPQEYYYQGEDNPHNYYPEGQKGENQPPRRDVQNFSQRDIPSNGSVRGRGQGKQRSRGRGGQGYNSQNREKDFQGPSRDQRDGKQNHREDRKENIPQYGRYNETREFSSRRGRGNGRASFQQSQGREFYGRGTGERNVQAQTKQEPSENTKGSNSGKRKQNAYYESSGNGYNPLPTTSSSRSSNNYNNSAKNKPRPESNLKGRNSPTLVETDDRASFEKRNNPERKKTVNKDGEREQQSNEYDKRHKFPTDKRATYREKRIEKVLAGKVDESQRGVLIEQLTRGSYECMVCCETVKCHHAVWNCSGCFHAFHLRCIKRWARSPAAVVEGESSGWRCPACQRVSEKFPNQYLCFCNKVKDPDWDRMETPHSCGQVCGKSRGDNCTHPCNILCHPGPCPPCNAVVNRTCACGKESKSIKCCITEVIKCEKVCGKALNCGKHFCKATCHSGSCQPCEEIIVKECYGSHEKKEVLCGCAESFTKSFSCGNVCKKPLECGNHECDKICHADECKTCDTLPEIVTHCPCGATPLSHLSAVTRSTCTDPIPTCDNVCNKPLGCGAQDGQGQHKCKQKCHEGSCGPCDGVTTLTCRCGAVDKEIPCTEVYQYTEENPFTCDKRCNRKRHCGRHKCGQLCCVVEEHLCNLICGRKLSCGLHKCEEPCHRGNCPPCLMTGYDELTCHCGNEVLIPPIPCGTKPPPCSNLCIRQHDCDHTVYHSCHSDELCPPCTVLTEKWCMGKHELRKNIPCHQNNVSCGLPCNKVLPCQQHKCQKTCHMDECQKEGEKCTQPCRYKRKECSHICGAPCHAGSPCPPTPCKAEVLLMCKCGNKEAKVPCMAGSSQETADYQKLAMQSLAGSLQSGQPVDISQLGKKKFKKQLDCDSECAVMERNRRMALALEIRNPDLCSKLGNPTYTDFLKDYAKQNPHFISSVEKALADLVKNAKQSKHAHRSHSFTPGNRDQRRAVHELAESYGCETQSYDYEPKKNVVATAYKDKCWLPSVTLTSFVQREMHPKPPVPIPHVHSEASLSQKAKAAKQSTDVLSDVKITSRWEFPEKKQTKPDIDYFDFSSK